MKKYLKTDEWNIIEDQFHPDRQRMSESIFSLGNGRFGQRGYFEEPYSSDSYRGSFVAGITFLDKTRVGWWKNGFPPYYTRIPKAADWSRINLRLIDEELDLAGWDVDSFNRRLDMKEGISYRDMEVTSPRGNQLRIHVEHITNMARPNLCLIKYSVSSINYTGRISLVPILDGNIVDDADLPNLKIWNILRSGSTSSCAYLWTQTRREDAQVCYAMTYQFFKNNKETTANPIRIEKEKQTGFSVGADVKPGDNVTLIKYTAIASSLYHERSELVEHSVAEAREAKSIGWNTLVEEHRRAWQEIWDETDVVIEGDPEAQQGIRYNIFQLYQTYRGDDPRLNIGPKGFTGEKYGGNTYWNTELCCVPFFLLSTPKEIAKNLLAYRYNQLPKAIENARKLGFKDGAALFPQVTNNGEECHSEWEITFEEIHRNNIIVYAIVQHAALTGNMDYIAKYGLEVMDSFNRRLDMKEGISYRDMEVTSPRGNQLRIHVEHITNMARPNLCLIKYSVSSINYTGRISLVPILDGNIVDDADLPNLKIWNILRSGSTSSCAYLWTQTRREDAQVCYAMTYQFFKNNKETTANPIRIEKEKQTGFSVGADVKPGDNVTLIKYTAIASSLYHERSELVEHSVAEAREAKSIGWNTLVEEHRRAWQEIWDETDVVIEGDPEAQQGIRYNIFQLYQTYRGDDPRLNIGPKGFTGEKYGGNTYWNTELCCVPFFLLSTPKEIAKNLLAYRYNQLPKAIENARKLGFKDGAALFPQVTNNGEECHSEWEITFEEIHRNNIIVYAIVQHAALTGNMDYIAKYGLEVMIAVSRFWSQRVSFSQPKQKYVILGVTGPDEYENNVDNNWYTNYSCIQCLKMTLRFLEMVAQQYPDEYAHIRRITNLDQVKESARWRDIIEHMYLPEDKERGIFIQNDGYMDKVLESTDNIPAEERPINQHWSWDRILRSCYIKQSDVLLGLYLYYFYFDTETVRRNFEFYEPMTVHESSLSPHIHSILAARIGKVEKAYQLFLHATRLDLDDYNNEADQGLHITSMPGSWLAIVRGFAGMQVLKETLCFSPVIPQKWDSYSFKVNYLKNTLHIRVGKEIEISLTAGSKVDIQVYGHPYTLERGTELKINMPMCQ